MSYLPKLKEKSLAVIEHLKHELSLVRAGRAHPSLIENVTVNAYGGQSKLIEISSITAPEANQLFVSPWDKSLLQPIEHALAKSGLGVNPIVEGSAIRVMLPLLTEERRAEYVKIIHTKAEEARIALRHVRGEVLDSMKKAKESNEMTEDELERGKKQVQESVDDTNSQIDQISKAKEQELMSI